MDYDCLEVLLKQSIRRADSFSLQSLAVVLNAFAELEIVNPTLLTISKQTILAKIDRKAVTADNKPLITGERPKLKPVDSAMFMAAFSRSEFFNDPALQESLVACFIERLNEADGPTTVTMLNAHAVWCHHMIEKTLIYKKQPKGVYRAFVKYNDQMLSYILKNLIEKADTINARGAIMMLINGRLWSFKRRDNFRMMKDFSIRAIGCLVRERESLGDRYEQYCVQYYDLTKMFCLKDEDLMHIQEVFQDRLKLDIQALQDELSPFAAVGPASTTQAAPLSEAGVDDDSDDLLGRLLKE